MTLDYNTKGKLKIDMRKYVKNMSDEFPRNTKKSQAVTNPVTKIVLKVDVSNTLNKNIAEFFDTAVARGILL